MFLLSRIGLPNFREVTHLVADPQLVKQLQKPCHCARRFDSDEDGSWQGPIERSNRIAFVFESLCDALAGVTIQHGYRLLASVKITSYNSHLGLLRPERCEGGHRTVYAGRREADVVMTSLSGRMDSRSAPAGTDSRARRLGVHADQRERSKRDDERSQ